VGAGNWNTITGTSLERCVGDNRIERDKKKGIEIEYCL